MADNISIYDSTRTAKVMRTTESGGVHTPHHHLDSFPAQHVDAFSRLRVSTPGYRFDSQLTYQIDTDLWDTKVTGTGTVAYDSDNRKATLTAPAGSNTAVFQSHYHAPYTPGRSQLAFVTFAMPGTVPANGEVGLGYFDGTNGIYLKRTATGLSLGVTSSTSATDENIAQASWNIDPMNGTGPSGLTLDVTKTNILVIQLQALYVGRVVCAFDIGGELVPVHAFNHANLIADPYIAQASLPVRYWATTSSDSAPAVIHAICSSVISEGGNDLANMQGRTFASYGENLDVDAAAEGVLVIRPKSTLGGLIQNAVVIPTELDVTVSGSGCWIEVRLNATVSGTAANVSTSSVAEEITTPTVTAGTGTLIDKFYLPASGTVRTNKAQGLGGKVVLSYSHLLGTADNIAIMAVGGTNTEVRASLKWKEIR